MIGRNFSFALQKLCCFNKVVFKCQPSFKVRNSRVPTKQFRLYHRSLTMTEKTDHLTRTSSNSRDDGIYRVTVKDMRTLSPTVKEVLLKSRESPSPFQFKAGQWVDVFIPGIETVGGFSMTSSPQELLKQSQMRLAIKYSTHPPALWMHEKCKIDDEIKIRVGGDFFLTSENICDKSKILLVAGGVGINPLCSILNYIQEGKRDGSFPMHLQVCLLYSAKTYDELIFKNIFDDYGATDSHLRVQYYLTGCGVITSQGIQSKRIEMQDIVAATDWLTKSDKNDVPEIQAFVCGPPSMIKTINENLALLKISKINFEQWW